MLRSSSQNGKKRIFQAMLVGKSALLAPSDTTLAAIISTSPRLEAKLLTIQNLVPASSFIILTLMLC